MHSSLVLKFIDALLEEGLSEDVNIIRTDLNEIRMVCVHPVGTKEAWNSMGGVYRARKVAFESYPEPTIRMKYGVTSTSDETSM